MSLIKDGLNSESMKLRDMIPWEKLGCEMEVFNRLNISGVW